MSSRRIKENKVSNPIKRKCPQCGKVRLFRSDCKTCGCPRPSKAVAPDPLVGRYFVNWAAAYPSVGQVLTRIQNCFLVRYDSPRQEEVLVPIHSMAGWSFSDSKKDMKKWKKAADEGIALAVLDEMMKEEEAKTKAAL
jgi:ribosomal protein L32